MSRRIDTSGKISLSAEQAGAGNGRKIIFTACRGQQAAFLIREGRLLAAHFFPHTRSRIGAVYICRVKKAARNLGAYFVEIGVEERETCFLSERDAAHPFLLNRAYDGRILEGDEFPVQVIRDAAKGKQTSVTTLISLANPYFVLNAGKTGIGYSNKLSVEQKERLKLLLKEVRIPMGLVVRTRAAELLTERASGTAAADALPDELTCLVERWELLFQTAQYRTCFSCLLEAPSAAAASLELIASPGEYEELLTDDRGIYEELLSIDSIPPDKQIRLYDEKQSAELALPKLYGLESKLDAALGRRVWLKSGAYLVIEPTEALTVIDVNSGKYETGKTAEETYARINREAAEEIVLQLRLRNLSGMIIVDFINMRSAVRQEELLEYLRALVKQDRQKTVVVDMTPLGLVEITRRKVSRPLAEQLEGERYGLKTDRL